MAISQLRSLKGLLNFRQIFITPVNIPTKEGERERWEGGAGENQSECLYFLHRFGEYEYRKTLTSVINFDASSFINYKKFLELLRIRYFSQILILRV